MKKFVSLLLTLLMISAMMLNVSANESENVKYDSTIIPESILTELGVREGEQVIAMYNLWLLNAFTKHSNIEDVLDCALSVIYMIIADNEAVTYITMRNGTYVNLNLEAEIYGLEENLPVINEDATSAFQSAEILQLLPEDIQIEQAYYLWGENNYEGTALYYVTNNGDYIYYFDHPFENGRHLFTLAEFCDYQKEIRVSSNPGANGGSSGGSTNADEPNSSAVTNPTATPKEKDTKPAKIFLWAGIPCITVLVIVGVIFGTRKMRKHKSE